MSGLTVKFSMADEWEDGPLHEHDELESAPSSSISRAARMLALAHHIDRLVNMEILKDYAHAARILGLTRARMAQVIKLLLLSPHLQESILSGKLQVSERQLRPILLLPSWKEQEAQLRRT